MTVSQTLFLAVRELDRLLGHLRTCEPCYTNEPCLDRHFLIKDVQNKTEEARRIARQTSTFPDGSPYIAGVHGPAVPPRRE